MRLILALAVGFWFGFGLGFWALASVLALAVCKSIASGLAFTYRCASVLDSFLASAFGPCLCFGHCFWPVFLSWLLFRLGFWLLLVFWPLLLVPASVLASVSARDLCFFLRVCSRFICFCPLRLSWFLFRLLLFASVLACVLGLVSVLAISSVRALAFLLPFAFRPLCWLLLWPLLLAIASVLVSVLALASVSALAFSYRFWPLLPCLCFGSRFCRGFCLGPCF